MRNSSQIGRMGESLALNEFVKLGYEVYLPFGGNTSCDFIVVKDGHSYRVEVKSSNILKDNGKVLISLRYNRLGINYTFDSSKSDLLACVLLPLNKVVILPSSEYDGRGTITLS